MSHQRPPEQLAKELWFYSLERRAQSTVLRRLSIALAAIAVVALLVSLGQPPVAAGAIAALAAAATLEVAGYLRGRRQKASVLAQLQGGANPQLVDAVASGARNRSIILIASAAAALAATLTFGLFA